MSDPNDTQLANGEEPFENERLLKDLKSLPRISAPLDFSLHLREAIGEIEASDALPWWKRFFRPASEGGFQIPAFAYGAAAAMVVLIVSVYVISVTDFEREMQQQLTPQPPAGEQVQEDQVQTGKTPAENEAQPRKEQKAATPRTDEQQSPAMQFEHVDQPAPATLPLERSVYKSGEEAGTRTGRVNKKPVSIAEPQSKTEKQLEFRTRGLLMDEGSLPELKDSLAADSLRKLDSLRRLRKDSPAKSVDNPR